MEKDGKFCMGCGEGSRSVGSTGIDPWIIGGSIKAVVAVAGFPIAAMSVKKVSSVKERSLQLSVCMVLCKLMEQWLLNV